MLKEELTDYLRLRFEKFFLKWQMKKVDKEQENELLREQLDHKMLKIVKRREDIDSGVINVGHESIHDEPKTLTHEPKQTAIAKLTASTKERQRRNEELSNRIPFACNAYDAFSRLKYTETKFLIPGLTSLLSIKHLPTEHESETVFFMDKMGLYFRTKGDAYIDRINWYDIINISRDLREIYPEDFHRGFYRGQPRHVLQYVDEYIGELRLVIDATYSSAESDDSVRASTSLRDAVFFDLPHVSKSKIHV